MTWYNDIAGYKQIASDVWRYNNPVYKSWRTTNKLQLVLINVLVGSIFEN